MSISQESYLPYKEKSVQGRYIFPEQIDDFLEKKASRFEVSLEGNSVQDRPIKSIVLGNGSQKILMWSQMHGNESTTTKAVLDLINYLDSELGDLDLNPVEDSSLGKNIGPIESLATAILKNCTITIIPMLNPDGSAAYTRANANQVDLNRDAADRSQPESVALRQVFDRFCPDYCFNLHDQRTIFNVGDSAKPATVSFLAPAHDAERSVSPSRLESMRLIATMNHMLQKRIPGQIGRYDDAFNPNCVGDAFQMTGTPTVLFEAGHHPGDYQREHTREHIFHALTTALEAIGNRKVNQASTNQENLKEEVDLSHFQESDYLQIPENKKLFFDILILHAHAIVTTLEKGTSVGVLYVEHLKNDHIHFHPKIEKTGDLKGYFGHQCYNCMVDSDLDALQQRPELLKILSNS